MGRNCDEDCGGKGKTVRQLMSSRKATSAVLGFIAVTRAGQRAPKQNQEQRQKERKRHEAWGLEADRLKRDEEEKEKEG